MKLSKSYKVPATAWRGQHLAANYAVHDHHEAVESIVDQLLKGTDAVFFCRNRHGNAQMNNLQLKDERRPLDFNSRYQKHRNPHSVACMHVFLEIRMKLFESAWLTDRSIPADLIPVEKKAIRTTPAPLPHSSADTTYAPQPGCRLLIGLPREIRDQIWSLVTPIAPTTKDTANCPVVPAIFVAHRSLLRASLLGTSQEELMEDEVSKPTKQRRPPSPTLACKQVREETLPMFFEQNVFVLPSTTESELRSVGAWLDAIGDRSINLLKSIVNEYALKDSAASCNFSLGVGLQSSTAVVDVRKLDGSRLIRRARRKMRDQQDAVLVAVQQRLEEMQTEHPAATMNRANLISLIRTAREELDPVSRYTKVLQEHMDATKARLARQISQA